ncbi:Tn3 family transposase [Thermomonospora umbrina]|uniref:Tn3 family transposase n=1 Tax=Thermomonospora umbrina TaxID=111806 RepID=UPI0011C11AF1|nr:Tn3 family transposase [Thermomonospora umbrina]
MLGPGAAGWLEHVDGVKVGGKAGLKGKELSDALGTVRGHAMALGTGGLEDLVTGSWRRLVFDNPRLVAPLIDRPAFVFCVLEQLHEALRRRDVYAVRADKWGDPRVRLIEPRLWVSERDTVLRALGLPADPREHLADLADVLDTAFKRVGAGVATNDTARISDGRLSLARLEAAPPPEGFQAVHDAVAAMLPRIDYPELLLEVNALTGFLDAMPHLSGSQARREDLDLSLAAVLVARSCNIGLTPVAKPDVAALTEHRLIGVEKGHFHGEGIGAGSAVLVDSQAGIGITADWGGGMVASTDGLRFVVPVRSLHARPSPLYFGVGKRPRGTTWRTGRAPAVPSHARWSRCRARTARPDPPPRRSTGPRRPARSPAVRPTKTTSSRSAPFPVGLTTGRS